MARVLTDAFNVATGIWGMIDNYYIKSTIITTAATAAVTLASSFGNKAVRLIMQDPTLYVDWNDLEGQIDRLANDRFDAIQGALAPVAIYDRKGAFNPFTLSASPLLQKKLVVFLGGTTLLGIAALSLQDCISVGDHADPSTSAQCWNQLGQHILEPTSLSIFSFGYALSSLSTPAILLTLGPIVSSILVLRYVSNGFASKRLPTFLRNKDLLLVERYQALATHFLEQWKKASECKNSEEINQIVKLAKLVQRKSSMLSLALEECLNVSKEKSAEILKPLVQTAKKIIEDAAKTERQEPVIIKKAE